AGAPAYGSHPCDRHVTGRACLLVSPLPWRTGYCPRLPGAAFAPGFSAVRAQLEENFFSKEKQTLRFSEARSRLRDFPSESKAGSLESWWFLASNRSASAPWC